ncbi:Putative glutathione S-transferase, Thioredoxin-like superfamily [Septoria linicola]|uniref:Glutathione S-transferase, Thioredoxin-like superfamily n=1 Tax=Septoria linicola TaxID=215465 RepID=A0A9Q9AFS6_9PEZI|nr:Putative glutathione S-transferase, Thioredoxin-like superfamily [Septoria linicola]
MSASNIHLYTTQTPNGIKISIALEELGLKYEWTKIDISKNTQKEQWFLDINPNGRIPALTDTFTDGNQIRLFESGSIMQYLVDRYDTDHKISFPHGSREHIEMTNWLFFMNAGVGPMQGQANHFFRYAPEKIEYGINRYQNETKRLYGVLDKHLEDSKGQYLVGDKCTIADIAHWGWISAGGWAGIDIDAFPNLKKWEERMWAREALKKGANIPDPYKLKEMLADKEATEKHAAESRKWIQQGMKEDAAKHQK